jgi:hypothetical protein
MQARRQLTASCLRGAGCVCFFDCGAGAGETNGVFSAGNGARVKGVGGGRRSAR